ncbi:uncharacterized protein LOC110097675 [Dendrobium catenatum]|uniref:uncharacterized protein LOC110097675 n=1 Tax=Dendrobium catenatum TaxID=906689 RepID=UPI0009F1EC3D|nr:uncharacterized protein LOC110097675 [Dendrobium catenatum]
MRIRKQASKLLGWAYHSPFASSSAQPPSEADAGEIQCQLNLSPWDAINSPQYTISQEELETADESPEITVAGNVFLDKEKEEENEELEYKAEEKESEPAGVMKCKKTDGKRWRCKRLAKPPHSLCSYHLTQLRSYRARFEDQVPGDHRKKPPFAVDCGGAASKYYYYYSILGPWWGKRRGPVNESTEWNAENDISSKDCNGKIADFETTVDGDNGEEEEEEAVAEDVEIPGNVTYKKRKKRVMKRRGRKPVKSRSLKSLL